MPGPHAADLAGRQRRRLGSKFWLLRREKLTPETVSRFREYALETLSGWWMRAWLARRQHHDHSERLHRPGGRHLRVGLSRHRNPADL
ncbi:phage GP46 family protein [Pseudodesulfovibrio cashew]|uniref:phage GP46 family protein n=1 Tax=Pseudodesulfovibrio cashew TaxID=2678688 RepID=UPI00131A9DA6|nr:phage GP46 family protein [Pseudodesulfovibrio cashew]